MAVALLYHILYTVVKGLTEFLKKERKSMKINAKWITSARDMGMAPIVFRREWTLHKEIKKATLGACAMGLYEACINGVGGLRNDHSVGAVPRLR